jgi:hypothetical protein
MCSQGGANRHHAATDIYPNGSGNVVPRSPYRIARYTESRYVDS